MKEVMKREVTARRRSMLSSMKAGAVAGLGAGAVMLAIAMANSWASGLEFWLPAKNIAVIFFGIEALLGGFLAVSAGLLLHMINSVAFGALFGAMIANVLRVGRAVFFGLSFGVTIWAVMSFYILPSINPVMLERVQLTPGWWFTYHMVFGIVLGMTPYADDNMVVAGDFEQDVPLSQAG